MMSGAGQALGRATEAIAHEAELVARLRDLEPAAWTELYEREAETIYRYVYARVATKETAEDLASTTFLEAMKSIRSYRYRGRPVLAWLYRIARNVVNQHHRRRMRGGPPPASIDAGAGEDVVPAGGDQQDPALRVEGIDLRDAIARLSPDQRDAIILRYYAGLTTPEAAAVMGKNERAVYSLQARAIKSLQRLLERDRAKNPKVSE